jgi:hypothetical protein
MSDRHDFEGFTQSNKILCAEKTENLINGATADIEPTRDATAWPSGLGGQ